VLLLAIAIGVTDLPSPHAFHDFVGIIWMLGTDVEVLLLFLCCCPLRIHLRHERFAEMRSAVSDEFL